MLGLLHGPIAAGLVFLIFLLIGKFPSSKDILLFLLLISGWILVTIWCAWGLVSQLGWSWNILKAAERAERNEPDEEEADWMDLHLGQAHEAFHSALTYLLVTVAFAIGWTARGTGG